MRYLEFLRRQRHLTQEQLGAKIGLHKVRISEYERGLRPTPANLAALAGFFGVPQGHEDRIMQDVPENIAGVPAPPSLAMAIKAGRVIREPEFADDSLPDAPGWERK